MKNTERIQTSLEKRSLHIFRELVALHESRTMTAAAKHLGMTLSTLSRDLEEFQCGSIGEKLLEPDGKSWKLTPRGESALPAIRDLVRQYEQMLSFLVGDDESPTVLRVGLGNFAAQHYFPRALLAVRQRLTHVGESRRDSHPHPPYRIETEVLRGRDRILGVFDGLLNCAIVSHADDQVRLLLEETRRDALARGVLPLTVEPLAKHLFCVIAANQSIAGMTLADSPNQSPFPLKQLANVELVGLDSQSGIRRRLEQQLRAIDREPLFLPGTGAGGWHAAKEFARAGVGAAVVPLAIMTKSDQTDFVLRHLPNNVTVDESLIFRPPTAAQLPFQEFTPLLRSAADEFCKQTLRVWSKKT